MEKILLSNIHYTLSKLQLAEKNLHVKMHNRMSFCNDMHKKPVKET